MPAEFAIVNKKCQARESHYQYVIDLKDMGNILSPLVVSEKFSESGSCMV